jgi:hypothetical protein
VYQKNIEFEVFKLVWVIIETDYLLEILFPLRGKEAPRMNFVS